MRIIVFVGSPISEDEKELVKTAKRLKKEKVSVDVICFGQEGDNSTKLGQFIATLNGKEGAGSHLLTVPPGQGLVEALASSVLFHTEDGPPVVAAGGSDPFGMDHYEDPELAMALRVSMEEQRARENAQMGGTVGPTQPPRGNGVFGSVLTEEADNAAVQKSTTEGADVENMTEQEQLAHAMRLSLCEPSIHGTLLTFE
ncbi:hypothetical protein RvY_01772 [Ramazzottius varieornatus]|uniref:26S proteasome non-ATPase regulatory subunit 4 n=1 Tax=Ramazzottius varieornatus TaxID=947166 RepID=A0A1D1US75_RAMVA|nr:hypothetical protein RvY_01772 [Ramazzottius varieornatus]